MKQKECSGFMLYHPFAKQFELLSMEERGILITALFEYSKHRSLTIELSPVLSMAFSFIRESLDRDYEAYLAKCKQNAENGKKGGRPRKNSFVPKNEGFCEEAEKTNINRNINKNINMNINMNTEWEKENPKEKGFSSDPLGTPSAPLPLSTPSAPPAPPLSEQERKELNRKGLEDAYIDERVERAREYAAKQRRSVVDVLASWWKEDGKNAKCKVQNAKSRESETASNKSYDLEEFFNAAVERALADAAK